MGHRSGVRPGQQRDLFGNRIPMRPLPGGLDLIAELKPGTRQNPHFVTSQGRSAAGWQIPYRYGNGTGNLVLIQVESIQ